MKRDDERRNSNPAIGGLNKQMSKNAKMAMPIVLMKDGSPQTPGANNLTPRS